MMRNRSTFLRTVGWNMVNIAANLTTCLNSFMKYRPVNTIRLPNYKILQNYIDFKITSAKVLQCNLSLGILVPKIWLHCSQDYLRWYEICVGRQAAEIYRARNVIREQRPPLGDSTWRSWGLELATGSYNRQGGAGREPGDRISGHRFELA